MTTYVQSTGEVQAGVPTSINTRITAIENNEFKVAYFASVSSNSGTITIPTGATILTDQFPGGIDAYVNTSNAGQPTGNNPTTAGGILVDVTSFDSSGNYVLTDIPSAYPVCIIYLLKIKEIDYHNLTIANVIEYSKTSSSPLTTKGDIYGFGTGNARVSVGSDATLFMADAAQANGVKWISASQDATIALDGKVTVAWANGYTTFDSRYLPISNPAYTGLLKTGTMTYTPSGALETIQSTVNSYNQSIIQNSNNGAAASSDFVVNNDQSTDTTFYGDFGMNSSGFSGSGSLNKANAVYMTATSGDLVLGTTTSNAIHFVINGSTTDAMTISTAGVVSVATQSQGNNSNAVATTAYVDTAVANNNSVSNKLYMYYHFT